MILNELFAATAVSGAERRAGRRYPGAGPRVRFATKEVCDSPEPHPAAASQPQRAGHIRIPNSLYDAITAFPFKLTTLRVLLAVLRKTEGYGKQEDDLSASQLASLCGAMSRQHVTTALNELAALNVIRKRPGRYGCVVGLNRDPAQWRQPARRAGVSGTGTGPQDGPLSESTAPDRPVAGQIDRPGFGQTTDNLPTDNPDNIPAASLLAPDRLRLPSSRSR